MHFTDVIGNTPLLELPSPNARVRIFGKVEGQNPGGSVKDRPAWGMIRGALERGLLAEGQRIIEATSGNTGIALAMIAAAKNIGIDLVMPANSTQERVDMMRAFGANVVLTPASGGMEQAIDVACDRAATRGHLLLDQFGNPDNWRAHFATTGPEIWASLSTSLTHFVSAMGTTGTITGVGRFLRSQSSDLRIVGCQPEGDAKIPGIRRWPDAYLPKIFDASVPHEIRSVGQLDAERASRQLASVGILVGVSSGGAYHIAKTIAGELREGTIVCILCDRGERYFSSPLFADSHPQLGSEILGGVERL